LNDDQQKRPQRPEYTRLWLAKKAERRRREAAEEAARFGFLPVDMTALAPTNSYGDADFVKRGDYLPFPFTCKSCGKGDVWTPQQQKWWYEVVKGDRFRIATLCRPCRAAERRRKAEARRVQREGLERKRKEKIDKP
jgi:hypothetical protein